MTPDEKLTRALRDAGMRVTSQRLVLHRALAERATHVSADELQRSVAATLPGLSAPTVYATLDLFERLGLVRRVDGAGGATLYDPRTDPHEHFVCAGCGRVLDVDATVDTAKVARAARRAGLEVDDVQVLLRGRCASCRG